MKFREQFIVLLFGILTIGCSFDSDSDTIVDDYKNSWIDLPQTRSINKEKEFVPAYVSEIGNDSKYIIAKQHPIKHGSILGVNFDTTNFYIIEITKEKIKNKQVYGTLDEAESNSLRRILWITDIKSDMRYLEY